MKSPRLALTVLALFAVGSASSFLFARPDKDEPVKGDSLYTRASTILKTYCSDCHGKESPTEDINVLDLTSLLQKDDRSKGPAVVAGDPDKSRIIVRIQDPKKPMPPKPKKGDHKPVPEADLAVLKEWIAKGAKKDEAEVVKAPSGPVAGPPTNPEELALKVQDLFKAQCSRCHAGAKAAGGLTITDHAKLLEKGRVVPKDADKSSLLTRMRQTEDSMPPDKPLSDSEIGLVRDWILAGAPAFEPELVVPADALGNEYVMATILEDVGRLNKEQKDLRNYRYVSFNHLLASGPQRITGPGLKAHVSALALALNHLCWQKQLVRPEPVDKHGTVFRVDISALGWDEQPYIDVDTKRRYPLSFWDLIVLEYPFGYISDGSRVYRELFDAYLSRCGSYVPLPYVRGDWFVNVALKTPVYEDMLQLPRNINDFETHRLGIDSQDYIRRGRVVRAGMTNSGVSRNNRVVERYSPRGLSFYWKSYDFKTNRGYENMFRDPVGLPLFTGGEMIWGMPNGMQGYLVTDNKGERIDAAPTEIVVDDHASDKIVRNGLACIRCHTTGIQQFSDCVRPVLDKMGRADAFTLQHAIDLYPRKAEMDVHVKADTKLYTNALADLFGEKPDQLKTNGSVLIGVANRYLDQRLTGNMAMAELGDPDGKRRDRFDQSGTVYLGLMQLAHNGEVARDAWEESYHRVVKEFNCGVPVVPLDGLAEPNFGESDQVPVTIKTNRKNYRPGDELTIEVENKSKGEEIYYEVIILGTRGQGMVIKPMSTMAPKEGKRFKTTIKAGSGKEQIILYASKKPYPKGTLICLPEEKYSKGYGMTDRYVHPYYKVEYDEQRRRLTVPFDPSCIIKRTIDITTE